MSASKEPVKASRPRPLLAPLAPLGRALLDLVYPPLCLHCADRLPPAAPLPLCQACRRRLPRAEPVALDGRLADFPGGPAAFDRRFALWTFDRSGPLQHLQHALKYGNRPGLGVALGRVVGEALGPGSCGIDAVVPVPLAKRRRLERGYNQSERLASGVADVLGVPVRADWLRREKPTRSQTALSKRQRWENVHDAFAGPAPGTLAGRHVLLVDDVFTTGATVAAAARPLRTAGARLSLAVLACTRA
ncbi:MAG: phosphoribosyltransferase family protein [Rhodothermales bacterium]|nr:phosphoribosyltransferase family protein [Rhodothermales bacterium]